MFIWILRKCVTDLTMRILFFLVCVAALSYTIGQYASRQQVSSQQGNGRGWDIRLAVPGEPGTDYPILGTIPRTSFSCAGKESGYYADLETSCQVFRICTLGSTYGFQSFLCPNGTLFNQQVFVCDWWMNVNCEASQKYFNNNNEKYSNLKLGPHMMNDIKKMITYSARNPYDKNNFKSNYVVMQDYKPPSGQLFPNGALHASHGRSLNSIYVPAKQVQSFNQNYNSYDNIIAGSTPSPQYVPTGNNFGQNNNQRDAEIFQRQSKGRYVQSNEIQNSQVQPTFSNGHSGSFTQTKNSAYTNTNTQNAQQNFQQQSNQQYQNKMAAQAFSTQNFVSGQQNQIHTQYRSNGNSNEGNGNKQAEYSITFNKEQFRYPSQQNTIKTSTQQYSNEISGQLNQINEAKENLVSVPYLPSTVVTKTLTFDRLIKVPNRTNPSSRLTFKSWVINPGKTARLILEPTPYVYDKPTNPPQSAKLISESTPYFYNKPTNPPQSAKLISEPTPYYYNLPTNPPQSAKLISEPTPYYYNKPTTAEKIISESGYVYDRPTISSRLISTSSESPRIYLAPTTYRPTIAAPLNQAPTTVRPTLAARLYLAPTSAKSTVAARLYQTPTLGRNMFSRQRVAPDLAQQSPVYYRNADLHASPTSPTPVYALPDGNKLHKPAFTFTKHSHINTNHNNLTFTDILTKEKLDITVHDIVKDTSKVLGTTSTDQLGQLRQEDKAVDYPEDNYLPPQQPSVNNVVNKSGKLVANLSTVLEPPVESFDNDNLDNNNPLANLPYYKQSGSSPTNTIERTVSLKISIPEKTAAYLFKTKNDSDFERLEILNTGSSNYLVLTNNNINKLSQPNFIPIGKLIIDKDSNLSNSQALVYSFIADSINVAKGYKSIVDENLKAKVQYQNVNNEDLSQITNKISQLTSSQYGQNNYNTNANIIATTSTSIDNNNRGNVKFTNSFTQNMPERTHNAQINSPQTQTNTFSDNAVTTSHTQNENRSAAKLQAAKQIYSGQLYQIPVPDVTSQIYNVQNEPNFIALNNKGPQSNEIEDLHRESHQGNLKNSNTGKQSSAEVEIVQSHSLPLSSPAKLQERPTSSTEIQNSQEDNAQQIFRNFVNSGNGITAEIQDKIVGSITHPIEEKKLVTYKKDQSYHVYAKLDENFQNQVNSGTGIDGQRNSKLIQNSNVGNLVTFQLIPSVSFQVEDEKEQERLLNTFQINEFGSPKTQTGSANGYQIQNPNALVTSEVDYSVNHSLSTKTNNEQYRNPDTLYAGPSSYSAPQASVGRLEVQQNSAKIINPTTNNNYFTARLEQFDEERGYPKVTPARQFSY